MKMMNKAGTHDGYLHSADQLPRSAKTCVTEKLRSISDLTHGFPTDKPVQTHRLPRLMLCLKTNKSAMRHKEHKDTKKHKGRMNKTEKENPGTHFFYANQPSP
jgi:hypothetical protein